MKLSAALPFALLAFSSFTYANPSRLKEINESLSKINAYRVQGLKSPELDAQEKKLLQEKAKLTNTQKKNDERVRSQTSNSPTYKKFRPQDYLKFIHRIESGTEKLAAVIGKLKDERGLLAAELSTDNRDDQKIIELREKIDVLEWEKTKIESSLAKTTLSNDLIKFKTGGIFDFYYGYSSNRGGDSNAPVTENDNSDNANSFRYYDNIHNDFTVNLVELSFSAALNNTSFFLELDFGEFAEQNAAGDEISKHIGQAFVTHDFDGTHSIAAGKMYTHVGFELAKPIDNWNYSRSYTFAFAGPFWHEGIALKGNYSNGVRAGVFVYDASDVRRDVNDDKTYGAQLGWANDKLTVIYNLISGPEGESNGKKRTVHEANAQYNYSDSLSFAVDFVSGADDEASTNGEDYKWQGAVGYVNWKVTDTWRLAFRTEAFQETTSNDSTSFKMDPATKGTDIYSHTLTVANSLSDRNEIRLELRHDDSKEGIYLNSKGEARKNQDTIVLAWVVGI